MMSNVKTHAYVKVGFRSVTLLLTKSHMQVVKFVKLAAKMNNLYLGQSFVHVVNSSAADAVTDEQKTKRKFLKAVYIPLVY